MNDLILYTTEDGRNQIKLRAQEQTCLGKGFSYANLRNFRQFYLTYPDPEICYTVCSKLSWSHNRLIMREEDPKARTFQGLFSEINLSSPKLGKTYADRNAKLCAIIQKIAEGLAE